MSLKRSVLVTDGEQRASLAVVRSLGRAGYRCFVCSSRRRPLAGASRFAAASARVPPPADDPDGFVRAVERLVARWEVDVLLPMTDSSLLLLLPRRDAFGGVLVPFCDAETFRAVSDKARIMDEARRIGIRVPEQRLWDSRPASPGEAVDGLRFPVVVKPARSVTSRGQGLDSFTVEHAADGGELARVLDRLSPRAYPVLVQEHVSGPGVGVFLLRWDGETLATFAHRRIREKPPSGGVSVYRESIEADPALVASSIALLEAQGWRGVAMVEYKVDRVTGTPFLMEVNGRFWGSLQLAVDAGVDFPRLLLDAAQGRERPAVTGYASGVRTRWIWGDVDHFYLRLRHGGRYARFLGEGADGAGRAIADFLAAFGPGNRQEVLDPRDPGPFLRETSDRLASLGASALGSARRRLAPSRQGT